MKDYKIYCLNEKPKSVSFFHLSVLGRHVDSLRLCALVPLWLSKYAKRTQFPKH
jgi:hypothetical protein